MMRSILGALTGVAVLLLISSCATTTPLGEGELRLLKMQVPENGNLRLGYTYRFHISFEAEGSPEIIRAVCTCADTGPHAYRVEDVKYGSQRGNFSLQLFACNTDLQRWECYVDYLNDGKRRRSNSVFSLVYGILR